MPMLSFFLLAILLLSALPGQGRDDATRQNAGALLSQNTGAFLPLIRADSGQIDAAPTLELSQTDGSWLLLNPPAARSQHTAVWIPADGQMLVFGGQAGARLNDLWSYRPAANTWSLLTPEGEAPPPVTGHSAVWDPVRGQMLIFGGHGGGSTDLWSYVPAENTWYPIDAFGRRPETRGYHSAVWDTANDQMLLFGGLGNRFNLFDDLWAYRPATNGWVQFAPRGSHPLERFYQGAAWDPVREQMLVFGGTEPFSGRRLDDLWAYKPATATWTQLTQGPRPPERLSHSAIWDPVADQMIVFGGGCGAGCYRNDMWAYRPGTNSWSQLGVNGVALPAARGGHSGVWDTIAGRLLVFAGSQPKGTLNDFWSYQPSSSTWSHLDLDPPGLPLTGTHRAVWDTQGEQMLLIDSALQLIWSYRAGQNTWSERAPIGPTPSAREAATAVWDPGRAQLLLFGGRGDTGYHDELWSYRPAMNSWARIPSTAPDVGVPRPPARWRHTAVWDPDRERMVIFGGHNGGLLDDLWAYAPARNAWEPLPASGTLPAARQEHSAVWGGGQMFVFGGEAGTLLNDVWSYLPGTGSWRQSTITGESPAARLDHAAAWDPIRQHMLIVGGVGRATNDETFWAYSPGENTWSRRPGAHAGLRGLDSNSAVWDPTHDRLLSMIGDSTGRFEGLWAYRPTEGAWSRPSPIRAAPPARQSHAAVWDPDSSTLLVFGGLIGGSEFHDDLWSYRPASRSWYQLTPDGPTPPEVSNLAAVWDADAGEMHVFGGFGPTGYLRDVWTYRLATNAWVFHERGDLAPPDREDHSAVWDARDGRMLVFGGGREGRPYDDLWSYDPKANAWTELTPEGTGPGARFRHQAVWDAENARLLVFGGYGGVFPGGYRNDLWSYDPATNEWTELGLDGDAPPPRSTHGAAWDADTGRLMIVGGFAGGIDYLVDVWSYDAGLDLWSELTPLGSGPTPRASHSAVWDGAHVLVYGGHSGAVLGELWRFLPPSDTVPN